MDPLQGNWKLVVTEMLEDFNVKLDLVAAVSVEVQFDPVNTTVKITDSGTSDVAVAAAAAVAPATATASTVAQATAAASASAEVVEASAAASAEVVAAVA